MTKTLTAVLLVAAGLAAAQTANSRDVGARPPSAEVKKPDQAIRDDQSAFRRRDAAQRARIADLNAQEKTAMEAITADKTLSKPASNAAKIKAHAEFKVKEDAIRAQMKADRESRRQARRQAVKAASRRHP